MTSDPRPAPPATTTRDPRAGAVRDTELFARRTARIIAIIAPLTLAITLVHALIAPSGGEGAPHGANTFSSSAVGYRGLVELLHETGIPALSSQRSSGQRASESRPLVLLEPPPGEDLKRMLAEARTRKAPVIVVLPKWYYRADPQLEGWVAAVELTPASVPASVLALVLERELTEPLVLRQAPGAQRWHSNLRDDCRPTLHRPQLIAPGTARVESVVWTDHGMLVGRLSGTDTLVIADPDLLNNAGLGAGDNAQLVHHLLVELFGARALVFDETMHGFTRTSSLWRELLEPPLLVVVLHITLVLAAVLWAALDRFGRPADPPARVVAGVQALVANTARLIGLAGMVGHTLAEYWKLIVHRTASDLAVTPEPGSAPLAQRHARMLARMAAKRGVERDLDRLTEQVRGLADDGGGDPRKALSIARSLYLWRKEMLDGSRPDR